MQHQASNPKKKRKVVPAEQEVPTSRVAASSRSITTLRMAPIFASMTEAHNNQTVDNKSPNDDDSDPDDELLEFTADITEDYNNIELLQEADRLHGYTPDDGYDAQMMEEDGVYPNAFMWTYEDVSSEGLQEEYYHYNGRGPALRHNVCNKFVSLLEACGVAGGFTYQLIKRITTNSNARANSHKKNNRFGVSVWKPIIVEEMYHFLGMTLKSSIGNRDLGGLAAYLYPPNEMKCGPDRSIQIHGFSSWAADIMHLSRFRQIRAALHPEIGPSMVGDQLRSSIESLNLHARRAFILGRYCSFDEGGIACKSRYNPLRQYNASKPDKYRIDFFVLVNASDGKNFIYHLDVCQGKIATNAHTVEEAWGLPTTQKAVVNAVVSSEITNDTEGMREIYMENRYTAPELFFMLQEKYQILACGTICTNRKGWDSKIMNLSKNTPRGASLERYDPVNKILFGQWNYNKVVSFFSSLGVSGKVVVERRVGPDRVELQIEEALKRYTHDNFMGGVDNVDKDKKLGGSFTRKTHFKKWYWMGLLGIFYFMAVNGRMAWNMFVDDNLCTHKRFKRNNWKFRLMLAEEMIHFKDEHAVDHITEPQAALNIS